MLAYHNNPQLKSDLLQLLRWHREMDKIEKGTYATSIPHTSSMKHVVNGWTFTSFGRGCAVGCSLESMRIIRGDPIPDVIPIDFWGDHSLYEKYMGIPAVLAQVEDILFERMHYNDSLDWPIQFAEAVNVGSDLSMVFPAFALYSFTDSEHGLTRSRSLGYLSDDDMVARVHIVKCLRKILTRQEYTVNKEIINRIDNNSLWIMAFYLLNRKDHNAGRFIDPLINSLCSARSISHYSDEPYIITKHYAKKLLSMIEKAPVPEPQVNS